MADRNHTKESLWYAKTNAKKIKKKNIISLLATCLSLSNKRVCLCLASLQHLRSYWDMITSDQGEQLIPYTMLSEKTSSQCHCQYRSQRYPRVTSCRQLRVHLKYCQVKNHVETTYEPHDLNMNVCHLWMASNKYACMYLCNKKFILTGRHIYIFGGKSYQKDKEILEVDYYDVKKRKWHTVFNLPSKYSYANVDCVKLKINVQNREFSFIDVQLYDNWILW